MVASDSKRTVIDFAVIYNTRPALNEADIQLPCSDDECDGKGKLRFAHTSDRFFLERGKWNFGFPIYTCRNCQNFQKIYAVAVKLDPKDMSGIVQKFGEIPAFSPEVPGRVISLIGPDRDLFLKG